MFVFSAAVGAVGVPVRAGDSIFAFNAKALVMVVTKFESSPIAAASSLSVSKTPGAPSIKLEIAAAIAQLSTPPPPPVPDISTQKLPSKA